LLQRHGRQRGNLRRLDVRRAGSTLRVERLRPFVGVNFGGLYGDTTNDTWAAGLEGGVKFYVQPTTFLFALVNYAWTFDNGNKATDNFNDGAFLWSVGVGFSL
ncbi:MAG: hypothetical protein RL376_263, partial [Verrucomicrobiota bacterium]